MNKNMQYRHLDTIENDHNKLNMKLKPIKIMRYHKDWKHEPEPEELVAEDATLKNIWKQEEYISLGRSLIIQDTLTIIQATPPSS